MRDLSKSSLYGGVSLRLILWSENTYSTKRLTGNLKLCFSSIRMTLWKSDTDEKYSGDLVLTLERRVSKRMYGHCQ